jgi:hypothetical protein
MKWLEVQRGDTWSYVSWDAVVKFDQYTNEKGESCAKLYLGLLNPDGTLYEAGITTNPGDLDFIRKERQESPKTQFPRTRRI